MPGLPRSVSILGIALLTFTSTASADPPPCKRWANSLTVCEALGNGSSRNCTHTPQGIETEQVNAQLFASTAQKACNQYIKKMNPTAYGYNSSKTIKACTWSTTDPNDNTCYPIFETAFNPPDEGQTAWCVYDVTGGSNGPDGKIDWKDATTLGYQVSYLTQTPDAHCFCTANGPYKDLTWQWEAESNWAIAIAWLRHTFPKGLKTAVLGQNLMDNRGVYKSDGKSKTGVNFDPKPDLQKDFIYEEDAAEIDHIIPRVDSKGCLCGDVTINNAAVISRKMNAAMSNTSPLYNEKRAEMYEAYVTCPGDEAKFQGKNYDPACDAERSELDPQTDESIIDVELEVPRGWEQPKSLVHEAAEPATSTETGGCSTGGLTGLGVALSLLGLRRRRTIR